MIKLKDLLNEYRIRGNADELVIKKGDIKKGMMVWFEDGKGSAKKLKVKHVMLSKDKKEIADAKLRKKWSQYKFEILGGFKDVAEGVIYEDWEIGDFDENLTQVYGLDFGFDDPDALIKTAINHNTKTIYLKEELYKNGLGSDELHKALFEICVTCAPRG